MKNVCVILLNVIIMTCCKSNKEIANIANNDVSYMKLMSIPDSLKTQKEKELTLKFLKILYTNTEFRSVDTTVVFLLDKDSALSEGLPEDGYLRWIRYVNFVNNEIHNSDPDTREMAFRSLYLQEKLAHEFWLNYFDPEHTIDFDFSPFPPERFSFRNNAKAGEIPYLAIGMHAASVSAGPIWLAEEQEGYPHKLTKTVYADDKKIEDVYFWVSGPWTTEVTDEWISIEPKNGDKQGTNILKIRFEPNVTGIERNSTIRIIRRIADEESPASINIYVTQKGTKRNNL